LSHLALIPTDLRALDQRLQFLVWLRSMPITFHQRLRIYFEWLDLHAVAYTTDEIDSLNVKEKIVEPESTA
jgi:hypothetical protein